MENVNESAPILKVEHVKKSFGDLHVLKDISFDLKAGEVLSIIGPSGSGKSTLLRCLTQLETVDGGLVQVDGKDMVVPNDSAKGPAVKYAPAKTLRDIRLSTGLVFQNFNLFPHLTVLQNICLAPVRVLGDERKDARAMAFASALISLGWQISKLMPNQRLKICRQTYSNLLLCDAMIRIMILSFYSKAFLSEKL